MSRKIILLNLALLALTVTLIWQARKHYLEMKAHEREVLRQSVRPRQVLPPPAVPAPAPVAAVQYIDVAQKTLFNKDRNPNVVVEPPPPPKEKPMPALPTYFGQIRLGDPVIFLAFGNGGQKRFYTGDKVGEFKLIAFDNEKITLGWDDKQVEKRLDELKAKADQGPSQSSAAAAAQPAASPAAGSPQIKSLSGPAVLDPAKPDSVLGPDFGDYRGCVMNDPTPAGAVVDGYRKVVTRTLMGNSCHWEKAK
ncbi:MAG: hypothetical protein LAO79_21075 [Acidobacteriia bacterium]|nr:hypothetical protein [Terriglobia bacterium]